VHRRGAGYLERLVLNGWKRVDTLEAERVSSSAADG
jgi:hypothetical protein